MAFSATVLEDAGPYHVAGDAGCGCCGDAGMGSRRGEGGGSGASAPFPKTGTVEVDHSNGSMKLHRAGLHTELQRASPHHGNKERERSRGEREEAGREEKGGA